MRNFGYRAILLTFFIFSQLSYASPPFRREIKIQDELFIMSEGLRATEEYLGADLAILNNPSLGFKTNFYGRFTPLFEDFFEYSLVKKSYITPNNISIGETNTFVHSFNAGTNYLINHRLKLAAKVSIHQLSFLGDTNPTFKMKYPWVYGLGAHVIYQLKKSEKYFSDVKISALFYLPKNEENYKINSALIYQLESTFLKRLTLSGFHLGGRFSYQLDDIVLNYSSFTRKEIRLGLLVEKEIY